MQVTEDQLNAIVESVVTKLSGPKKPDATRPSAPPKAPLIEQKNKGSEKFSSVAQPEAGEALGCFTDMEEAIKAATRAFEEFRSVSIEQRKKIIQTIREFVGEKLHEVSRIAVDETGYGRYEDKLKKNRLAVEKTPGYEDLEPTAYTGDDGMTLLERAPFGVIAAITPVTNATETPICNGIGMIAGGNTVVFNPHPGAKKTAIYTIDLMNRAVIAAGGPPNLMVTIAEPSIETGQKMMKHPGIGLLVVTGGPAVVKQAMNSGKRVVAAGPGNPPVVVDETADLDQAGRDIVLGASLDNNIICVIEKEVVAVSSIANKLKESMIANGAVELSSWQAKRVAEIVVDEKVKGPNKKWVGKDIQRILAEIGMTVDDSKRLAFAEVPPDHPFAKYELLLPVIGFVRAKNVDEAIELAYYLEGGCFHTSVMHSRDVVNLHKMAVKTNTAIFVKNAPAYAGLGFGGEGPASFTIASPTGEGVTTARHFTRTRRCVLKGYFRIT